MDYEMVRARRNNAGHKANSGFLSTNFTGPSIYPYLLIITVATVAQLI